MKKLKYIIIIFSFITIFLTGCSVNTITKISDEVEYTKIENDITQTYDDVKGGCVAIVSRTAEAVASGSGVVFKYDKTTDTYYVVTNNHVIEEALSTYIYFNENRYNLATIIGGDSTNDIAVLKFQLDPFNESIRNEIKVHDIFNYEDNDMLAIGQTVLAIGCPLSLSNFNQLSTGVVSKISKTQLTVDCALNPGNSGGGLFNLAGRLIGIVNQKTSYVPHGTSTIPAEGLNYAIPLSVVKVAINDIISTNKSVSRPTLGITLGTINSILTPDLYEQYKDYIPVDGSYVHFVVMSFAENSKAQQYGLLLNDVILKINGTTVSSNEDIAYILHTTLTGDITLTVYRAKTGLLDIVVKYE